MFQVLKQLFIYFAKNIQDTNLLFIGYLISLKTHETGETTKSVHLDHERPSKQWTFDIKGTECEI